MGFLTANVAEIYQRILRTGRKSSPRGEMVLEVDYFHAVISDPWSLYPARLYNIDYYKREMQWYLGANPFDNRILKHATMWKKLMQEDGRILSNYGYYWFGDQGGYQWVIDTLEKDPDSRQAYIAMNNYHHAFKGNVDFVCTKGIQFRIIEGRLWMHVAMRSSDAVYGLGTDLPCFHTLWCMVARELSYPLGKFVFSSDSVHLYEKHFKMAKEVVEDYRRDQFTIPLRIPELEDPRDLIDGRFESEFGQWLLEAKL